MTKVSLLTGDCLDVMRDMPADSVDSIVTDPPYGLSFMGKAWDKGVPSVEVWTEALRALKPGGHLLAFAGTRTQHRMAVAIEDAGFEIRDMIAWVYGSGFPKSRNVGREVAAFDGWGTALKPALEPITVARKPLAKGNTVAANVLEYGTGAINVDGCRVGTETRSYSGGMGRFNAKAQEHGYRPFVDGVPSNSTETFTATGRWPANLIHDGSDEVLACFPDAPGQVANASTSDTPRAGQNVYGAMRRGRGGEPSANSENNGGVGFKMRPGARRGDTGSAARFFYCAKASKADRNGGCGHLQSKEWRNDGAPVPQRAERPFHPSKNNHPTVKPTDLMRYLCRLVTPPGGMVLDPFMGSGSTGRGAVLEGFAFTGIDAEPEYVEIARARIAAAFRRSAKPDDPQMDMFADQGEAP